MNDSTKQKMEEMAKTAVRKLQLGDGFQVHLMLYELGFTAARALCADELKAANEIKTRVESFEKYLYENYVVLVGDWHDWGIGILKRQDTEIQSLTQALACAEECLMKVENMDIHYGVCKIIGDARTKITSIKKGGGV